MKTLNMQDVGSKGHGPLLARLLATIQEGRCIATDLGMQSFAGHRPVSEQYPFHPTRRLGALQRIPHPRTLPGDWLGRQSGAGRWTSLTGVALGGGEARCKNSIVGVAETKALHCSLNQARLNA